MLKDSFNRTIDYLRVSITDRCSLRCLYCMPPEGVEWKPNDNILTYEQILRITRTAAGLGIRKIKVTGGEPLLRRGMSALLKEIKTIKGIEKVTLTTNGILLGSYIDGAEPTDTASLPDSINISLNALDTERYRSMTRCRNAEPAAILPVIDRLLEKQITVKINCVILRSVNEEEILPLTALAKDKNIVVRFIELMPIGSASGLQFVSGTEITERIKKAFGNLAPFDGIAGNGPAVYYSLYGFTGKIGFINAVTHGFCETCNRLRLTSEGFLKLCLFNDAGIDLRELIQNGADDHELADAITEAAAVKPRSYGAAEQRGESMSEIGG